MLYPYLLLIFSLTQSFALASEPTELVLWDIEEPVLDSDELTPISQTIKTCICSYSDGSGPSYVTGNLAFVQSTCKARGTSRYPQHWHSCSTVTKSYDPDGEYLFSCLCSWGDHSGDNPRLTGTLDEITRDCHSQGARRGPYRGLRKCKLEKW